MGSFIKILIVNDDDTVEVLPVAQYEKLLRRDLEFSIGKYAGRSIRYASVFVEVEGPMPPKIVNAQYSYLVFDSEGRLDIAERGIKANLALGMLPPVYQDPGDQLIDARQKFAKKKYENKYKWRPSFKILAEIEKILFET